MFMKNIFYYKEVSSTMDIAHEFARKGFPDGTVIVAEKQTKGRGRNKNNWHSPEGGLWFSIILYPSSYINNKLDFIGILISTSIVKALERFMDNKILNFKWPNDIELNGKKVAGILLEGVWKMETLQYIIVGAGINLFVDPYYFIEKNLNATSLLHHLKTRDKFLILNSIIEEILIDLEHFPENWERTFNFYYERFPYRNFYAKKKQDNKLVKILDITKDGNIILEEEGIKIYPWGGVSLEIERSSH